MQSRVNNDISRSRFTSQKDQAYIYIPTEDGVQIWIIFGHCHSDNGYKTLCYLGNNNITIST